MKFSFKSIGRNGRRSGVGPRIWWAIFASGMVLAMLVFYPMVHEGPQPNNERIAPVAGQDLLAEQDEPQGPKHPHNGQESENGEEARASDDQAMPSAAEQDSDSKTAEAGIRLAEMLSGGTMIRVELMDESRVETVPIEWYVRGVVAGEMPADFEMEALKAQAIAARTYIVRKLLAAGGDDDRPKADVSDTTDDQVYVPVSKLAGLWPDKKAAQAKLDRISQAVAETKGLILTYNGEPIQASYFSTSNGYTENSEDYWSVSLPYLRSVPSPWDTQTSPRYKNTVTMKLKDFYKKLDVRRSSQIKVVSWTDGRRVKELAVGKERVSGREARERLGLYSSQFDWKIEGDTITLTSFGYGHGVGMSQYGANALAKAGNDARQILRYYYKGVTIEQASKLPEWAASFES